MFINNFFKSDNPISSNNGLKDTYLLFTVIRQKSKPIIYPSISWISKKKVASCEHNGCFIKISFDGGVAAKYPAIIKSLYLVNIIYILDKDFEQKLENHSKMQVDVRLFDLKQDYIKFNIHGFKSEMLDFQ